MSSHTASSVRGTGNDRVLTIDWSLLLRRFRARGRQAFASARYNASRTEYTPPAWFTRLRITWFRLGLMGIAVFVFTQKQIDFTVSVGKDGFGAVAGAKEAGSADQGGAAPEPVTTMGLVPTLHLGGSNSETPVKTWSVDDLNQQKVEAYIRRFEKVARAEENKYSIPAAANMALAIIHSNAGTSTAAQKKNNHFFPVTRNTHYENAWTNWRSHSQLIDGKYPGLAAESVNYQQWTAALLRTDYSSDRELGNKIKDVVERYGLERL